MPPPTSTPEVPPAPLADFFWIAGVDGSDIYNTFVKLGDEYHAHHAASAPGPALADTIEEDAEEDAEAERGSLTESSRPGSRNGSYQHLSRLSSEAMRSAGSNSNRSSITTIRAAASPSRSSQLSDFDFDKALRKFAAERESFLTDLNLSAGVITSSSTTTTTAPPRPKPRPRTQKIIPEEVSTPTNPLKSGIGSVRRHMSFRDMSSVRRQPSVARQGEVLPFRGHAFSDVSQLLIPSLCSVHSDL